MICNSCLGQCCFDPWEATQQEFKRITARYPIPRPTRIEFDYHWVIVGTKNLPCPYLTEDFQCGIYYDRPQYCREMGTRRLPCADMLKASE